MEQLDTRRLFSPLFGRHCFVYRVSSSPSSSPVCCLLPVAHRDRTTRRRAALRKQPNRGVSTVSMFNLAFFRSNDARRCSSLWLLVVVVARWRSLPPVASRRLPAPSAASRRLPSSPLEREGSEWARRRRQDRKTTAAVEPTKSRSIATLPRRVEPPSTTATTASDNRERRAKWQFDVDHEPQNWGIVGQRPHERPQFDAHRGPKFAPWQFDNQQLCSGSHHVLAVATPWRLDPTIQRRLTSAQRRHLMSRLCRHLTTGVTRTRRVTPKNTPSRSELLRVDRRPPPRRRAACA